MDQHTRICNNCDNDVTYMVIDDAHDPHTVTQFVATILDGKLKENPVVTDVSLPYYTAEDNKKAQKWRDEVREQNNLGERFSRDETVICGCDNCEKILSSLG